MSRRYGRGTAVKDAIEADLALEAPAIYEKIVDAVHESDDEESVEAEIEHAAFTQANSIYFQIKLRGDSPSKWWRAQPQTDFNRKVYLALEELWESRGEPLEEDMTDLPIPGEMRHPYDPAWLDVAFLY